MKIYDLWPFYLSRFTRALVKIINPFETLYYLGIGLSYTQIAMILTVKNIVTLIFAVPTSKFAEKYGNKCSVIVGNIFSGISMILVAFVSQYWMMLILSGVISFFKTFYTGSDKAWIGEIIRQKYPNFLLKYFGYSKSINNFGIVLVGILGTFIVERTGGMEILWIVAGLGYILAGIFLLFGKKDDLNNQEIGENLKEFAFIRENYAEGIHLLLSSKNEKTYLIREKGKRFTTPFSFLKSGINELLKNKLIIFLFLGMSILHLLRHVGKIFWGPFFQENGFDISKIGWLYSISGMLGIIVPIIMSKLKDHQNGEFYFLTIIIFLGVIVLCSVFSGNITLLILSYLSTNVMDDFIYPLDNTLSVNIISKKSRSVILSMRESVKSGIVIIGSLISGVVFDMLPLMRGGIIIFLLTIILGLNYSYIVKRNNTQNGLIKKISLYRFLTKFLIKI